MTNAAVLAPKWSGTQWIHRRVRHLLRLSLEMKLLVPNTAVILLSLIAFAGIAANGESDTKLESLVISLLIVGAFLNFMAVRIALRPIKQIQDVAEQVAHGNMDARVQPSIIADVGLSQLAETLNETLEYLAKAREKVREQGAKVVNAQDHERMTVARELHESIGQTLAAASYHAAAATRTAHGQASEEYVLEISRLLRIAIEDLRNVSRELHPRVADDLGLPAALESLARATMNRSPIDVRLSVKAFNEPISSATGSTIYRIVEQALRNIEAHSSEGNVRISISLQGDDILLSVDDDCSPPCGTAEAVHASLAPQGEKVALLGGELVVGSNFIGGTNVTVRLRRQQEAA